MSDFANTLSAFDKLCGKREYQLAQYSGFDPTFVRRLFDGEKRALSFTTIRLTIALVMDPELARRLDMRGSPVIVEYKRAVSRNLVNHGLFYLDWLDDHRAEYRLLVEARLGSEAAATIDWTGP